MFALAVALVSFYLVAPAALIVLLHSLGALIRSFRRSSPGAPKVPQNKFRLTSEPLRDAVARSRFAISFAVSAMSAAAAVSPTSRHKTISDALLLRQPVRGTSKSCFIVVVADGAAPRVP